MKNKYILASLALVLTPAMAFGALGGFRNLLMEFYGILQLLDNLIFAIALVYFFWGVAQSILKSNDDKAREEGRKKMMWGVIALFVLASWWGILLFLGDLISIDPNPNVMTPNSQIPNVGVITW
ncbi:MAG: hypothetical protein V4690_04300 [Patescibacteria group bacterium]